MPLNKDAYTRYLLIDQRINNRLLRPPSIDDLILFVSEKMNRRISKRTIQGDLESMRHDTNLGYFAPIKYDGKSKGYVYEDTYSINQLPVGENDLQSISLAINILSKYKDMPAMKSMEEVLLSLAQKVNFQKEQLDTSGLIVIESNAYIGLEYITPILEAINEKKMIYLDYKTFQSEKVKVHKVHPYFLKEFENRIYLIGLDVSLGKDPLILTFALDRTVDLSISMDYFKEKIPDRELYFKHLYGISDINKTPEKLIVKCNALQAKFFETNPIHASQQILSSSEDIVMLQYFVVMNKEITMKLLALGSQIEVVEPLSLREELKMTARRLLSLYDR